MPRTQDQPSTPESLESRHVCDLEVKEVARRLDIAPSTLNGWLRDDEARPSGRRVFEFHRCRGRVRKWSEIGFRKLEIAIHLQSQHGGVLAQSRVRRELVSSPPDPDAEAAMDEVLGNNRGGAY
ncbi:MAG TPA: hypothetical protein VGL17_04755 [Gemmatimonadaceae bacterium]